MVPAPWTEDFYPTLDVDQSASREEITRAYRKMALKLHPDKNVDQDTTEAFQKLGEAYDVLKDAETRSRYDAQYDAIKKNILRARRDTSPPVNEAELRSTIRTNESLKAEREKAWKFEKRNWEDQIAKARAKYKKAFEEYAKPRNLFTEVQDFYASDVYKNFFQALETEEERQRKEQARRDLEAEWNAKEGPHWEASENLEHLELMLFDAEEEFNNTIAEYDANIAEAKAKLEAHGPKNKRKREEQEKEDQERAKQKRAKREEEEKQREREERVNKAREDWQRAAARKEEKKRDQEEKEERERQQAEQAEFELQQAEKEELERQQAEQEELERQQAEQEAREEQERQQAAAATSKKAAPRSKARSSKNARYGRYVRELAQQYTPAAHDGCSSGQGTWVAKEISSGCFKICPNGECKKQYRDFLECSGCEEMKCFACGGVWNTG